MLFCWRFNNPLDIRQTRAVCPINEGYPLWDAIAGKVTCCHCCKLHTGAGLKLLVKSFFQTPTHNLEAIPLHEVSEQQIPGLHAPAESMMAKLFTRYYHLY